MRQLSDEQIRELEERVSALEFENKQLITKHHKEVSAMENLLHTTQRNLKVAKDELASRHRAQETAALAIQALDDLVENAGSFKKLKERWRQHIFRFRSEL